MFCDSEGNGSCLGFKQGVGRCNMRQVERIAVVASDFDGADVWLVRVFTDTNAYYDPDRD